MLEALSNSLVIASISATLATVMGTMAALALQRVRSGLRIVLRRPYLQRDHHSRHRARYLHPGRAEHRCSVC